MVLLQCLAPPAVFAADAGGKLPRTALGALAARMAPGEIRELATKNCNRDLFKMWYDWEADDIKKYGSQKMFTVICWNNDMKWDPVTLIREKKQ